MDWSGGTRSTRNGRPWRKHGTEELGTNPTLSVLALFPGAILIVPAVWTSITTYQRSKRAQQFVGVAETEQGNPWIYGILYVFLGLFSYAYLQSMMNKIWTQDSGAPSGIAAPAAAAVPAPPEPAAPAPPAPPAPEPPPAPEAPPPPAPQ